MIAACSSLRDAQVNGLPAMYTLGEVRTTTPRSEFGNTGNCGNIALIQLPICSHGIRLGEQADWTEVSTGLETAYWVQKPSAGLNIDELTLLMAVVGDISPESPGGQPLSTNNDFFEPFRLGQFPLFGMLDGGEEFVEIRQGYFGHPCRFNVTEGSLHPDGGENRPVIFGVRIERLAVKVLKDRREEAVRQRTKDELLRRIQILEITEHQAQEEADLLGFGQLNPTPDPAEFDPMGEARWTFAMALAWLVWEDVYEVRQYWSKWRHHVREWRNLLLPEPQADGTTKWMEGRCLVSIPSHGRRADLALHVALGRTLGHTVKREFEAADRLLWDALMSGKLDPDGIDLRSHRRVSIPPREFQDLRLQGTDREADFLAGDGLGGLRYDHPSVSQPLIVEEWPLRRKSKNEMKREATQDAIHALGIKALKGMGQKEWTAAIIAKVKADAGLKVGDTFVKKMFAKVTLGACNLTKKTSST